MRYAMYRRLYKSAALTPAELEEDYRNLRKMAPKTFRRAFSELKGNNIKDPIAYMRNSADGVGPVVTRGTFVNEGLTRMFNKYHRGFGAAAYLHDAFCLMPIGSNARRRAQHYIDSVLRESGARKECPKLSAVMSAATLVNDKLRHHLEPLNTVYKGVSSDPDAVII